MADALTIPFAVAAIVLCAAGVAKLRAPRPAVTALASAGVPAPPALVRALAVGEIALGAWSAVMPGHVTALLLACVYATFCCLSLALARRRVACGCFGEREAPASSAQSLLSGALASVALAAAVRSPQGAAWIIDRPAATAGVLALAITAAVYATMLVYRDLPTIWAAWNRR